LQLFAELIALPQNAIRIKCYDFEGTQQSTSQWLPGAVSDHKDFEMQKLIFSKDKYFGKDALERT
jgi:hypothetical protein